MTTKRHGRSISLDSAREAKMAVGQCAVLREHAQGIGISREGDEYYVKVNLSEEPPAPVFNELPKLIKTSGGDVRVVYQVTGRITGSTAT